MYSPFKLTIKFLQYHLTALNGKGHGTHSPFVFEFITKVLNDKKNYAIYRVIEQQRQQLLQDNTEIDVEDFGAGSGVIKTNKRIVKKIAASSLKPKKYAQLLHRMVQHYQPNTVIELGSSFGITTSYLASASANAYVYTCEGAKSIAAIAQQTFNILQLKNIKLTQGSFETTLTPLLIQLKKIDFAFIDGNHRHKPTVQYFAQMLPYSTDKTIFVFDDIHWSTEMEAAWNDIKQHPQVTLSINLFFVGIICINPSIKVPQHFTIRF
jgi:predicted O-methyltransferase YrrM